MHWGTADRVCSISFVSFASFVTMFGCADGLLLLEISSSCVAINIIVTAPVVDCISVVLMLVSVFVLVLVFSRHQRCC